jgi:hypothetical protein
MSTAGMNATAMKIKRIQTWVWVFVYAGILTVGIGLTARHSDSAAGGAIALVGAALVAVGALLVWIRSRMPSDITTTKSEPTP